MNDLTILIIAYSKRAEEIKNEIRYYHPQIDVIEIIDNTYVYQKKVEEQITRLSGQVQGVFFGSVIQHDLYHALLSDSCPCCYIARDYGSYIRALMKLTRQKINVERISIDHLPFSIIEPVYKEYELDVSNVICLRENSSAVVSDHYYHELIAKHKRYYKERRTEGVITTIPFVKDILIKDGVPTILLTPTSEAIVRTIQQLVHKMIPKEEENFKALSVILIHLYPKKELALTPNGEYLISKEKLKAAEEIHLFAKTTKAMVITQSDDHFTIVVHTENLMTYTQSMTEFPLLQFIWNNTDCSFSVGIGLGKEPWDTHLNATIALKRAHMEGDFGVFLSHSPINVMGPLQFLRKKYNKSEEHQLRIQEISEKTGISQDRIWYLEEKEENQNFVLAKDLCEELNLSLRGANRMLSKLEEFGYAVVVGKKHLGKSGRPSNVYKLMLK